MKFIDNILGEYHLHDNNASGAFEKHYNAVLSVIYSYEHEFNDNLIQRLKFNQRIAFVYCILARTFAAERNFKKALLFIKKAFMTTSLSLRTYLSFFYLILFFICYKFTKHKLKFS